MDFLERLFGISPDGGDGSAEVMIIGAVVVSLVVAVARRSLSKYLTPRS